MSHKPSRIFGSFVLRNGWHAPLRSSAAAVVHVAARLRSVLLRRVRMAGGGACSPAPSFLIPACRPGSGGHRWNEVTGLFSHAVQGDVTPLLVTRKRTEWYISSLSSPQGSESGRVLAADSYTTLVLVKVMV